MYVHYLAENWWKDQDNNGARTVLQEGTIWYWPKHTSGYR